jgi:hypothetical protein
MATLSHERRHPRIAAADARRRLQEVSLELICVGLQKRRVLRP